LLFVKLKSRKNLYADYSVNAAILGLNAKVCSIWILMKYILTTFTQKIFQSLQLFSWFLSIAHFIYAVFYISILQIINIHYDKPEALMLMPLLKGKWYFKTEGGL